MQTEKARQSQTERRKACESPDDNMDYAHQGIFEVLWGSFGESIEPMLTDPHIGPMEKPEDLE